MPTRLVVNPVYPPESAPFAQIAAAFPPRLAAYCGIDPKFVFLVANDRYTDLPGLEPFFLYIQFFGIEAFGDTGGGRLNPWAERRLRVYIYTRSGVDMYGTDNAALLGVGGQPAPANATIQQPVGQFQAEELVMGALFNWSPTSPATGKALMSNPPVHPASGSGPPLRKAEDADGLLRTNLDFQVRYGLAIDKTDPPL